MDRSKRCPADDQQSRLRATPQSKVRVPYARRMAPLTTGDMPVLHESHPRPAIRDPRARRTADNGQATAAFTRHQTNPQRGINRPLDLHSAVNLLDRRDQKPVKSDRSYSSVESAVTPEAGPFATTAGAPAAGATPTKLAPVQHQSHLESVAKST